MLKLTVWSIGVIKANCRVFAPICVCLFLIVYPVVNECLITKTNEHMLLQLLLLPMFYCCLAQMEERCTNDQQAPSIAKIAHCVLHMMELLSKLT